jgi:major type 1 subunit fimbrin (pilin)
VEAKRRSGSLCPKRRIAWEGHAFFINSIVHFHFDQVLHMSKTKLFAALLLAVAPLAANATDGTITFTGKITEKTCTATIPASKDLAITLPTATAASLATAGAVAGRTPFTISLTGCSVGKVAAYFEPGSTVDFDKGRMTNMAVAPKAANVQIQLLGANAEFLPILASGAGGAQTNSQWVDVTTVGGSAALNYFAEYYATGAASSGDVSTSVKYNIIYN